MVFNLATLFIKYRIDCLYLCFLGVGWSNRPIRLRYAWAREMGVTQCLWFII